MSRYQITFLLFGIIAGLTSVTLGTLSLEFLAYGVGPLFFVAIVAGITITGAWRQLRISLWRYPVGLLLSTITYMAALVVFSGVGGFSPNWFGVQPSAHIEDFGVDVWLGLIAAGAVGAIGIALFTAVLTGKWSKSFLLQLVVAGLATIVVTYLVNLSFRSYWSFLGVLFPVGNAIFCYLVGAQVWRSEVARPVSLTAPAA